jgi:hypothetical protein
MRCAALLAVSGCSFVFTSSPGPVAPGELPVCTTTYASVIADAIGAVPAFVVGGYLGVVSLEGNGKNDAGDDIALRIAVPALALGVGFAIAAIYGAHAVGACNAATDESMLALIREAEAGTCEHVVAFAKRLAHRDVAAALLFVHDATFARCF